MRSPMDEDLKGLLEIMRQENGAAHVETRHQFEVIAEGLRHELRIVAEGVTMNTEQLHRLETKVDRLASDLDTRVTHLEAASSLLPK